MITLTVFALFAAADVAPPAFFAPNEELRAYLLEAADHDPGLKARYSEWKAALERVPQVTSLDDPMFMYTQFVQSEDKRYAVSLEQKFPWFGTLRARGDKALAEAEAALERFYAARNAVFAAVKEAYFEYGLLGENIRIVESQIGLLASTEAIVRDRYSLGLSAEADVYRVQIEQEKTADTLKGLNQSRAALAAKLDETLGRAPDGEIPWPQPAEFPPAPPDADAVATQVKAANPDLAAMQHLIDAWEDAQRIAKKMGYPDFSVGIEYGNTKNISNPETPLTPSADPLGQLNMATTDTPLNRRLDDVMISLKFSLPIWRGRVNAGIREAENMRDAVEHDKRRSELALDSAARKLLFQVNDGLRRYALYKDTLAPKQKQTYESLRGTYSAGDSQEPAPNFIDLMDSLRTLLEFQLEQARAARDVQIACAELEMLMGNPWDSGAAPTAVTTVDSKTPQASNP